MIPFGIVAIICCILVDVLFLSGGPEYFIIWAGWFDTIIIGVCWLIYEQYRTPSEAKILRKCRNEKRIPVIAEDDNSILNFDYEVSSTPEGAILTKNHGPMFTPRSMVTDSFDPNETLTQEQIAEAEAIKKINPIVSKTTYMPGVGMPVRFGYTGKAILTNVQTAAELQHGAITMVEESLPSQKERIGSEAKEVKVFWPVSLKTLKSYFPKSWNIAAVRAMEKRAELIGMEKERQRHRMEKMWIFFLIAAGVFIGSLVIAVVALRSL